MNLLTARAVLNGVVAATLLAGVAQAKAQDSLSTARADLQSGKADDALAKLNAAVQSDPKSAEALNLLCRVQYSIENFNDAADNCQKAVALNGSNARYHLWLGRALGERASRAAFLSAYGLAKKTRAEFEQAVKLDPKDADALSDLGEFYKEAPGAVGGGTDKAGEIARQLDSIDPARAHNLRASIAEKQKDIATAEQEYKAACIGPHAAIQWMELASFYRRQSRWTDMESAIHSGQDAAAHEKHAAIALFNGANILARANRNPDLAIKLYEAYLASPDKTEDAPAFDALTRLAKLRRKNGDQPGADRDRSAALALAREYKPAIDAFNDKGK